MRIRPLEVIRERAQAGCCARPQVQPQEKRAGSYPPRQNAARFLLVYVPLHSAELIPPAVAQHFLTKIQESTRMHIASQSRSDFTTEHRCEHGRNNRHSQTGFQEWIPGSRSSGWRDGAREG